MLGGPPGVILLWKNHVRSFGVLLDPAFLLDKQEVAMARTAVSQFCLVRQPTITPALVTSGLDYCNALWRAWKLQLVRNAAARLLMGVSKFDHATPVLSGLHWLHIIFRAQINVLLQPKSVKLFRSRIFEVLL